MTTPLKERITVIDHGVLQHIKSLTPALQPNTRRRKKERFKLQTAAALQQANGIATIQMHISPARASFKSLSRLHCIYMYGYNTYIAARTCCNAANPSFCNSQLMGGGRMIASSTFRLLSTNSYTRRRNLERGLRARSSFWSRICTYLRVCRQLSIACQTVIS